MPQSTGATSATNSTPTQTSQFDSVRAYTEAKQAGDDITATGIVRDAMDRFADGTITPGEFRALFEATMTVSLGGAR